MKIMNNLVVSIVCLVAIYTFNGCNIETDSKKGKNEQNMKKEWSGIPGDINFSSADRMAIRNVIDAFATYWDNHRHDDFFSLFTKDAFLIWSQPGKDDAKLTLDIIKVSAERKFKENDSLGIQQRHLMMNTHFIQQTTNSAHTQQYVVVASIEGGQTYTPGTTMMYDFWFEKTNESWKIAKYKISADVNMNLPKADKD